MIFDPWDTELEYSMVAVYFFQPEYWARVGEINDGSGSKEEAIKIKPKADE